MSATNLFSRCANLTSYLQTLSSSQVMALYEHPATCLAIYRELPTLSQQIISRLLFVEQEVPKAVITSWVTSSHKGEEATASKALSDLGVWTESSTQGGMVTWKVNDTFRENLQRALLGGGDPWTMSETLEPDKNPRDKEFLDKYSQDRWSTVLHFMVASSRQQEGISDDAVQVLTEANLVMREGGDVTITSAGFQFLLMDSPSQVWYFMLQYLETCDKYGLDVSECLNFLFQLSFSELGKDYSTAGLSQSLLIFLQHLREFGLVYQRKRSHGRFYPTRLALNIASGENKSLLEQHREGYIVVETNYRIYAYTDSDLQVALINLFAEPSYRFPNLYVSVITRDSTRQAFRCGITATQITKFLQMHAHPRQQQAHQKKTREGKAAAEEAVPPTVIDQIFLWEKERDRFTFTDGVLYNQFLSQGDFETVKNFAESSGVCTWFNDRNRTIVVTRSGHSSVKAFWRQHSQR